MHNLLFSMLPEPVNDSHILSIQTFDKSTLATTSHNRRDSNIRPFIHIKYITKKKFKSLGKKIKMSGKDIATSYLASLSNIHGPDNYDSTFIHNII